MNNNQIIGNYSRRTGQSVNQAQRQREWRWRIIWAVLVCAGHVPFPDEHGENQPAEVVAPL